MREFPLFIPWEDDHLAAVVTVPDGDPRGLVLLLTGLGAPRSHRFQMWAIAAARLSDRGVASVRWEYRGLHDSTGSMRETSSVLLTLDQAATIATFAEQATGIGQMGVVGNCHGAEVALMMAAERAECIGAMCILPEGAERGRWGSILRRLTGRKLSALVRARPILRRLSRPIRRMDTRPKRTFGGQLAKALGRNRIVFLYDQIHMRSGPTDFSKIRKLVDRLPQTSRDRCELWVISSWGLDRFGSVETQEAALDAVDAWADQTFELGRHHEPPLAVAAQ